MGRLRAQAEAAKRRVARNRDVEDGNRTKTEQGTQQRPGGVGDVDEQDLASAQREGEGSGITEEGREVVPGRSGEIDRACERAAEERRSGGVAV